jgi:hypothetical protein
MTEQQIIEDIRHAATQGISSWMQTMRGANAQANIIQTGRNAVKVRVWPEGSDQPSYVAVIVRRSSGPKARAMPRQEG